MGDLAAGMAIIRFDGQKLHIGPCGVKYIIADSIFPATPPATDGGKARILSRREKIWADRHHPDPKDIRDILAYDSETGVFRWKSKPPTDRHNNRWNTLFSGNVAGSINHDGYRYIKIDCAEYAAHRIAWAYVHGDWPDTEIDHCDRNRDNNQISNLRLATHEQNMANSKLRSSNTSGLKGVSFIKPENRWRHELCWVANIQLDGKTKNLGHFATKEEAGAKYDAVARAHYGNYFHSELLMDHADTGIPSDVAYHAPERDPA